MNIIEGKPHDLSLAGFENAVVVIGGIMPDQVTLLCSDINVNRAYSIMKEYNCTVVLIPSVILKNDYTWAVCSQDSVYWSPVTA